MTCPNDLDGPILLLVVERPELTFLLPIVERTDHDDDDDGDQDRHAFYPIHFGFEAF